MLDQTCLILIILTTVEAVRLNESNLKNTEKNIEEECFLELNINQWTKGCNSWHQALDADCKSICNGTQELLSPKELFCIAGCNEALNRYYHQLKARIGVLSAPTLVGDSLTATSLRLEWNGNEIKRIGSGISYFVQWKYQDLAETWQFCRNQSWRDDQILVYNLQSYTKYRFRIALLLRSIEHNAEMIVSTPSIVISTKPAGVPISAPRILRANAIDSHRISISWEAGPFSNGPLLSYVLKLYEDSELQSKEVPATEILNYYVFRNLEPSRNYSVSVSMRNAEGDGPSAIIHVSTSSESVVKDTEKPLLILGSQHSIMKQGSDIFDEPSIIYETSSIIQGIAIHVVLEQIFISDSMGFIYRKTISDISKSTILLNSDEINFKPLSMSVDWLNLRLYIVGQMKNMSLWQIARCDFVGNDLTVVVPNFLTKPSHVEVDPYNGYLFWITRRGFYRLDLADIDNSGNRKVQPFLILEHSNLGAFIVDHINFRLLVSYHSENTVKSVSLDGKEVIDLRANTQQAKFKNVSSLTVINNLFYWTNGYQVLTEGYHSGQDKYFHNVFPRYIKFSEMYLSVHALMSTSQPIPVPVNPPTNVQAILGSERAKISWQAPYLLAEQGRGAWQNWMYELEIKDDFSGETIHQIGISDLTQSIFNLKEKSNYSIKAAAYSIAGKSPWSKEFKGQTLRDEFQASILWSTNEGFLISDITGENLDILIHDTNLTEEGIEYYILDVSWYKDLLYFVGNNSLLYQYNMTSRQKSSLNINSVSCIAVDWISKKLYWTNPKQQIIMRSNMNGSDQEPISILANVKELVIDSLEAYLYWSTDFTIQVARLNGQERRYYYSDEIFSDKQVTGLSLDLENRFLYWIIRSYENVSILYRAPTSEKLPMNQKIVPEKISILEYTNIQGPLCYFSQHLLWLQDDRNAIIGDMKGQNTAVINGITLSGLHMTSILNPLLHQFPKFLDSENITVLPNSVNYRSIKIEGNWTNFNISWDPVNNTNYGIVFYKVKFVDVGKNSIVEITTESSIAYNNLPNIQPYSLMDIKIKVFTYWESARYTRKTLRSPQSTPSQPLNSRGFVEFQSGHLNNVKEIDVIFRWDSPQFSNGVILGFIVKCWYIMNEAEILLCDSINIPASTLEYRLHNVLPKMTYYFQVEAYTEVGVGPNTDVISISTENENPLLQLLIVTTDMVQISDLDQQINYSINRHSIRELTYLAADEKIFLINEMQELVTMNINGENTTKILSLNNPANSICVDWISRNLFWIESSYKKSNGSYVMKLDLSAWSSGILKYKKIILRNNRIVNLDISPSKGKLFWVELNSKQDRGVMMYSDIAGENVKPFFNKVKDCSCPFRPIVRPVFTIDNINPHNPIIYWVSLEGHLYESEIDGCFCNLVISSEELPSPTSLTVDKKNIYWSNTESKKLYFVDKVYPDNEAVKQHQLVNAKRIKTIGKSLQPYPDVKCLTPAQTIYNIEEISKTKSSIRIKMPKAVREICENYNLPSTLYTIVFSEFLEENSKEEKQLQTYDTEIEIENLKSFAKYRFKLALSNYYGENGNFSLGVILKTGSGIPSRPRNVTVKSLTPTTAAVYWLPPETLNADKLYYEIHYTAIKIVNFFRKTTTQVVQCTDNITEGTPKEKEKKVILDHLVPNEEYKISVLAYNPTFRDYYNQSFDQHLKMYPEPSNLTVKQFTRALRIFWSPAINLTVNYSLEFSSVSSAEWQIANISKIINNTAEFQIIELEPKNSYKFRLNIKYLDSNIFTWPSDDRFIFETLGDVPSAPGKPTISRLRKSVYKLNWEPAKPHGSTVIFYRLEGRIVNDLNNFGQSHRINKWKLYYNGTDNCWTIDSELVYRYYFRVQANNVHGFGNWSESSEEIDLTYSNNDLVTSQPTVGSILIMSSSVVISVILFSFCFLICRSYKQRKEDKKAILSPRIPGDMELATLREIPRGNFIQSNALYGPSTLQVGQDDEMLPKLKRDEIILSRFLGSGAFGEVFQGTAKDLNGPGFTPVAIKTLRKGASSQEKSEFIQEARLMSHFRHKHVLLLLGVCLETDSPLLVLELMEAGDLLSYLRSNRAIQSSCPSALTLQDLLSICEDVARGCRYLEELHFVHRDLACRNCLVSSNDRQLRVVKIGDFGLARDIYKNDYYRKEGEGLLPVRWMAPESLVDGVFTSQSDVWAFGVLMWEITSLGQQPYPARTNQEVLHYVRSGGRLQKPLNCPNSLHQLMLSCWSCIERRPSFKTCLEEIINLRVTTEDSCLLQVFSSRYLSQIGSKKSNNSEGSQQLQSIVQESIISPALAPKYLELLSNPDEWSISPKNPLCAYEVPKSTVIHKNANENFQSSENSRHIKQTDTKDEELSNLESQIVDKQVVNKILQKKSQQRRLSVTSLNIPEKKRNSLVNYRKKSRSLDNRKSRNISGNYKDSVAFTKYFRNERKETKAGSIENCSSQLKTSLKENINSSRESNASLDITRPSSSIINSETFTKVSSKISQYNLDSKNNKILNLSKIPKSNLQKAKIPLMINNALLNLLQQTPDIDDNERIITYTIVNTDALRVNGS
ncbi:proto-oncogene tyrosine-protein kinase ROS isoform X2 [Leptopilina heterotoma]|uniref:proto-oncogene tyrosine-protein kinase ROS isoform X2 n=1 Tax=Leptopilina heterotoma TaxID=63436 RepID=UPI001CA88982|nr:proto-oncogene tyrosine-protein kinase ROS isoform X2 [Leptopilina heterotoma]